MTQRRTEGELTIGEGSLLCWIEWPQNNKEGGVELIITRPILIKNLLFLIFYYDVKKINNRKET